MSKNYTSKGFIYTDPVAYDERLKQPIEEFVWSLWDQTLLQYIKDEITKTTTVADLGCGTFIHTKCMGRAKHIYAVDINQKMLDYGKLKLEKIKNKVTILCESGTHTSIPDRSCDLVWIDGLSEFVNLDELFREVKRITKSNAKFIVLFPNKIHPENVLVSLYYWFKRRSGKKYRTLYTFKKTALRHGFKFEKFESTGLFFYAPSQIQKYLIPLWKMLNRIYQPYQKSFPIGSNILCTFIKK